MLLSDDWEDGFFHSRDRRPPDDAAALSDMLTVRLGAILTELGTSAGLAAIASRPSRAARRNPQTVSSRRSGTPASS